VQGGIIGNHGRKGKIVPDDTCLIDPSRYTYRMMNDYVNPGPERAEIDVTQGPLLLEFGTLWCGHCQAAAPAIAEALQGFPAVEHIKVEDGPGRPLGRSFRVKLWPTLIFLKDGVEMSRAVRPAEVHQVREGLERIST
jgi:thioredoxin 1